MSMSITWIHFAALVRSNETSSNVCLIVCPENTTSSFGNSLQWSWMFLLCSKEVLCIKLASPVLNVFALSSVRTNAFGSLSDFCSETWPPPSLPLFGNMWKVDCRICYQLPLLFVNIERWQLNIWILFLLEYWFATQIEIWKDIFYVNTQTVNGNSS